MEKKFKCKDEVIYRDKNIEEYEWTYGIFSHSYKDDGREWYVINGEHLSLKQWDILPYEGNEELVGTTDSPDEEVKIGEEEFGFLSNLRTTNPCNWSFGKIKHSMPIHNYVVRFSDFNPSNMEETKKHILVVKNGKIVKYKE